MIKGILVGLSGTNYSPVAVQHAIRLAQLHGAQLTGTTVLDETHVRNYGEGKLKYSEEQLDGTESMRAALAHTLQSIDEFESACKAAEVKYSIIKEVGNPFSALVDRSRYHDLMIFGLQSAFEQDFLYSDIESFLIRTVGSGMRPLIAVPNNYREISRIVIAYDGSMGAAQAMKQFCQIGIYPDSEVSIMTFEHSERHARDLLKSAEVYCRSHRRLVYHEFVPGTADKLLDAAMDWNADMIVMGNSARSILLRKVLGDTLLKTLRETPIPLFLA